MDEILSFLLSVMRISTPLLFAALGGFLSEKSGVVNVALEGFMLIGAFTAATIAYSNIGPGSEYIAWISAFSTGSLFASLFAFLVIQLKAQQIVSGMAMNILAMGFIPFLSKIIFNSTGSTPSLNLDQRLLYLPFICIALLVSYLAWGVRFQFWGLWLQFAGEHPAALLSRGVSVKKVRWLAVVFGGGVAAWGGATLALSLASGYSPLMTSGRGFMALAALIFGRWSIKGTVAACLFFGFVEALQIRLQNIYPNIPLELIQISPYILTLIAIAFAKKQSAMPKYLGHPLGS